MKILMLILLILLTVISCIKYFEFSLDGTYTMTLPFRERDRLDINGNSYTYRKYLYSNLFEIVKIGTFEITHQENYFDIKSDFEPLNGSFVFINNTLVDLNSSFRFYKQ